MGHPIRHILGAHIEATSRPGELYEYGTTYQPHEAPLPLTVDDLFALDAALVEAGDTPQRVVLDRFRGRAGASRLILVLDVILPMILRSVVP